MLLLVSNCCTVDKLPKGVSVSYCKNKFSYEIRHPLVDTLNILSSIATVEPTEAQNNIGLPVEVTENNIELLVMVAQNKINLPIEVKPIVAQNKIICPLW